MFSDEIGFVLIFYLIYLSYLTETNRSVSIYHGNTCPTTNFFHQITTIAN